MRAGLTASLLVGLIPDHIIVHVRPSGLLLHLVLNKASKKFKKCIACKFHMISSGSRAADIRSTSCLPCLLSEPAGPAETKDHVLVHRQRIACVKSRSTVHPSL